MSIVLYALLISLYSNYLQPPSLCDLPHAIPQIISNTKIHRLPPEMLHIAPAQDPPAPLAISVLDLEAHDARVEAVPFQIDAGRAQAVWRGEEDAEQRGEVRAVRDDEDVRVWGRGGVGGEEGREPC